MLRPREEITLSYLTGLAPVGEPLEFPLRTLLADLGFRAKWTFYKHMHALIGGGYVRKIAVGRQGTTGVLVVLRRLEESPRPDAMSKDAGFLGCVSESPLGSDDGGFAGKHQQTGTSRGSMLRTPVNRPSIQKTFSSLSSRRDHSNTVSNANRHDLSKSLVCVDVGGIGHGAIQRGHGHMVAGEGA